MAMASSHGGSTTSESRKGGRDCRAKGTELQECVQVKLTCRVLSGRCTVGTVTESKTTDAGFR